MVRVLFVALCFALLSACKPNGGNVWTADYEQKKYDEIYRSLETAIKNPEQRKLFTQYIIKNFKQKLPKGLESISADSLRQMSFQLGKEYSYSGRLHAGLAWTAINEKSFRTGLENEIAKKIPNEKIRSAFCDCLMIRIKQAYPDSIVLPIPDTLMTRMTKSCYSK